MTGKNPDKSAPGYEEEITPVEKPTEANEVEAFRRQSFQQPRDWRDYQEPRKDSRDGDPGERALSRRARGTLEELGRSEEFTKIFSLGPTDQTTKTGQKETPTALEPLKSFSELPKLAESPQSKEILLASPWTLSDAIKLFNKLTPDEKASQETFFKEEIVPLIAKRLRLLADPQTNNKTHEFARIVKDLAELRKESPDLVNSVVTNSDLLKTMLANPNLNSLAEAQKHWFGSLSQEELKKTFESLNGQINPEEALSQEVEQTKVKMYLQMPLPQAREVALNSLLKGPRLYAHHLESVINGLEFADQKRLLDFGLKDRPERKEIINDIFPNLSAELRRGFIEESLTKNDSSLLASMRKQIFYAQNLPDIDLLKSAYEHLQKPIREAALEKVGRAEKRTRERHSSVLNEEELLSLAQSPILEDRKTALTYMHDRLDGPSNLPALEYIWRGIDGEGQRALVEHVMRFPPRSTRLNLLSGLERSSHNIQDESVRSLFYRTHASEKARAEKLETQMRFPDLKLDKAWDKEAMARSGLRVREEVMSEAQLANPDGSMPGKDQCVAKGKDLLSKELLKKVEVKYKVYSFEKTKVPDIWVPLEHDRLLNEERERVLAGKPRLHPHWLLPEQAAQIYEQSLIPTNHVKAIELRAQPDFERDMCSCLEDHSKYGGHAETAGDMNFSSGRMRIFQQFNKPPDTYSTTFNHEQWHAFEKDPSEEAYDAALALENGDPYAFHGRDYGKKNRHENYAVLGGEILAAPRAHQLSELAAKAPARALVLATDLARNLGPEKPDELPHLKALRIRAAEVEAEALDLQIKKFSRAVNGADANIVSRHIGFLYELAAKAQRPDLAAKILASVKISEIQEVIGSNSTANLKLGLTIDQMSGPAGQKSLQDWSATAETPIRQRIVDMLNGKEKADKDLVESLLALKKLQKLNFASFVSEVDLAILMLKAGTREQPKWNALRESLKANNPEELARLDKRIIAESNDQIDAWYLLAELNTVEARLAFLNHPTFSTETAYPFSSGFKDLTDSQRQSLYQQLPLAIREHPYMVYSYADLPPEAKVDLLGRLKRAGDAKALNDVSTALRLAKDDQQAAALLAELKARVIPDLMQRFRAGQDLDKDEAIALRRGDNIEERKAYLSLELKGKGKLDALYFGLSADKLSESQQKELLEWTLKILPENQREQFLDGLVGRLANYQDQSVKDAILRHYNATKQPK